MLVGDRGARSRTVEAWSSQSAFAPLVLATRSRAKAGRTSKHGARIAGPGGGSRSDLSHLPSVSWSLERQRRGAIRLCGAIQCREVALLLCLRRHERLPASGPPAAFAGRSTHPLNRPTSGPAWRGLSATALVARRATNVQRPPQRADARLGPMAWLRKTGTDERRRGSVVAGGTGRRRVSDLDLHGPESSAAQFPSKQRTKGEARRGSGGVGWPASRHAWACECDAAAYAPRASLLECACMHCAAREPAHTRGVCS